MLSDTYLQTQTGGPSVRWEQRLVSGPSDEPLDVATVRDQHLRSPNGTNDDTYIGSLIVAARSMAESVTRRALMSQQWSIVGEQFPAWTIEIPKPPMVSLDSISYVDANGDTQTLTVNTNYLVSTPSGPKAGMARVTPAYGVVWPSARCQVNAVTVTFTAGYPEDQIPGDILQGMLLVIGEMYTRRAESVDGVVTPAVMRARDLWLPYRVY